MFELKQGRIELPNAVISMEPIPGLPRSSRACPSSGVWCPCQKSKLVLRVLSLEVERGP